MKNFIVRLVNDRDEQVGKWFGVLLQILVISSIITLSMTTLPELNAAARTAIGWLQVGVLVFFTFEYLLRIYAAEDKSGYLLSGYGIIDFLAVAPFYLIGVTDMAAIRALRVFTLFRMFKLVRYAHAQERVKRALVAVREELLLVFVLAMILIYLASIGVYHFEHSAQPEAFKSVPHSFWWSVVTLTTVGYGDIVPITFGGKLLAALVILVGIGIVTAPAGLLAYGLIETRNTNEQNSTTEREFISSS